MMESKEILLTDKDVPKKVPLNNSFLHLKSMMGDTNLQKLLALPLEQQVRVVADLYAKRFTQTSELMQ